MKTRKLTTLLLALLMIVAAAFTLAACGGGGGKGDPYEYGDAKSYINTKLTGDYSITYKFGASENGQVSDSSYYKTVRTAQGFYFSAESDSASDLDTSGALYIKDGNKYYSYTYSSSESKFKKYGDEALDAEYVEDSLVYLSSWFMAFYGIYGSDEMKPAGSEKVAGRTCNKYTYKYGIPLIGSVQYNFSIDKETGVCMKFSYKGKAMGDSAGITFECTEFLTSGVSLPAYA